MQTSRVRSWVSCGGAWEPPEWYAVPNPLRTTRGSGGAEGGGGLRVEFEGPLPGGGGAPWTTFDLDRREPSSAPQLLAAPCQRPIKA